MSQRQCLRQSLAATPLSVDADAWRLLSTSGWARPLSRSRRQMPNLT